MSYLAGSCDCDCSGVHISEIQPLHVQCKRCSGSLASAETTQEQVQRLIWNVARAPSSLYIMNLAAQNVVGGASNAPVGQYGGVNWNQMSDRAVPGVVTGNMNIPRNRTRAWPGHTSAPGAGVDVKHDSYARYLARKKVQNLRTNKQTVLPAPEQGNKQYAVGFIPGCVCTK